MGNLVVISGGSSGLGLALAKSTPFPARVVDISRTGPPSGTGIDHIAADLAETAVWPTVTSQIYDLVDSEDPERAVLIHAAGTLQPIGFAGEIDSDEYAQNVVLNSAVGQILGDTFLRAVRGRSGTYDLVMVTSGAAGKIYPGWSSYGAGKAALDQWVRTAGEEQKIRGGVRICAIAPGVMDTAMQAGIREMRAEDFPSVDRFRELHERGELVAPDDAARRMWGAIQSGLEPGSVIDLREF